MILCKPVAQRVIRRLANPSRSGKVLTEQVPPIERQMLRFLFSPIFLGALASAVEAQDAPTIHRSRDIGDCADSLPKAGLCRLSPDFTAKDAKRRLDGGA